MSNIKLINCMECNSLVSPTARQCPSCGTGYFDGVDCSLCEGVLKVSDSQALNLRFRLRESSHKGSNMCTHHFHPECYQKVHIPEEARVSLQVTCPACNNYTASIQWSPWESFSYYQGSSSEKRDPYVSVISSNFPSDYIGYRSFRIINSKNSRVTDVEGAYSETCPSCGHSINFKLDRQHDPYAACYICDKLVDKKNAYIGKSRRGYQVYIHEGGCQTFYKKSITEKNREQLYRMVIGKRVSLSIGFGILGVVILFQFFTYWFIGIICFIIAYSIWQAK